MARHTLGALATPIDIAYAVLSIAETGYSRLDCGGFDTRCLSEAVVARVKSKLEIKVD